MSSWSACDELRRLIHKTHLSYLNRDDTPDKLDQKTKLEGLIVEYLSMVSNSHKFNHLEVADCLSESVVCNANFSAYKTAVAFEILEKFAVNLLMKPWRKEFRVICPYSGFYKHMVDKQLFGSERLLYLMGYKRQHFPHSVINLTEAPLDPDKLASIALDCLVAFVECQIMIQVYDVLKRKGFNVTWAEIHEVREKYICGMDEVIRFIIDMKRSCKLIDLDDCTPSLSSKYTTHVCRGNYLVNNGWSIPEYPSVSKRNVYNYPNESEICNENLSRTDSFDLMHFPVDSPQLHTAPGNYFTNLHTIPYITPPPPPMFASNYADESSYPFASNFSKPNKVSKGIQAGASLDALGTSLGQLNVKSELCRVSDTLQNNCDHNNREAQQIVTKKDDNFKATKKGSSTENAVDTFDTSLLDSKNRTLEKTTKKLDNRKQNISTVNSKGETSKIQAKTMKGTTVSKCIIQPILKSSTPASADCGVENQTKSTDVIRWSCSSCTFLNTAQRDICEMCSRSKERGPENTPLVSGGKECPRCTLVNDKNIDYCTACETNLIDSPTYI